jgi:6-pyruvoyltetrahydropterin/6-carboxytetrahydropterin synthase
MSAAPSIVRMTRRVTFSSGHRYWLAALTEAENRARFGAWASPYNHGHNYGLDVTVDGQVDPATGMVVNIKRIDDILKARILRQFDQRSINDEIPHFHAVPSTMENLLDYIAGELLAEGALPPEVRLSHLRLEEMPLLWAELTLNEENPLMTLTRVYEFAASHRLHAPALSDEENLALFGKCNNPNGHGHNYVLEVTVAGEPDPTTGMMADLGDIDAAVKREVVDRYDHRNLNEDIPEFQGRPTTSEVVAQEIFSRLKSAMPNLYRVRLHETARNIFEVTAA